jgi:divalent metal cation (Fe/Co/Zn/Cd) transporter
VPESSPKEVASSPRIVQQVHDMQFAMQLSLAVGVLMLLGKVTAYFMTHSAAILSDAVESHQAFTSSEARCHVAAALRR